MASGRRRTTLSHLSQSTANARITPARSSLGNSKTPRTSLGGRSSRFSTGSRRSSVFGNNKMQEPRPIGDKSYTQENIRSLIHFLTSRQYDREISPKILSTPARKDFVSILSFLFRHIYPNFEFANTWDEDVPILFEAIGYPFRISKRSLLSVGSPHTWPSLLAALVWLADLINYNEDVELEEKTGGLEVDNGENAFYGYLSSAYTKFLGGADNFSFLEDDLAQQFNVKNKAIHDDLERFQSENQRLKTEIAACSEGRNLKTELLDKRTAFKADIVKFEKLVRELQEYKENIRQQRVAKQQEFDNLQNEMASLKRDMELKQTQMEGQELSAVDVQRMAEEREMLEKSGSKLSGEHEEAKKKMWQLEMDMARSIENVEKCVRDYNAIAMSIQLTPGSAKYAHGIEYELRFDSKGDTIEQMLSVDLKRVVKPALAKLKEGFLKTVRTQQANKRQSSEKMTHSNELKLETVDSVKQRQARFDKLSNAYKEQRELMNKELLETYSKVEDLELELGQLENSQNNALANSEKEIAQLDQQFETLQKLCAQEQETLQNEVNDSMDRLAQHKYDVVRIFKELQQVMDKAKASLLA